MSACVDVRRELNAVARANILGEPLRRVAPALVVRTLAAPLTQQDIAWLRLEYAVPGAGESEVRMSIDIGVGKTLAAAAFRDIAQLLQFGRRRFRRHIDASGCAAGRFHQRAQLRESNAAQFVNG